jgi:peroxiredoxin
VAITSNKKSTDMKTKSILMFWLAAAMFCTAKAQTSGFTLQGKIGTSSAKAYLIYKSTGKMITDSAMVENGSFSFKGTATEPMMAQLILDHQQVGLARLNNDADYIQLYLEKGTITITGKDSVKTAAITGSKLNDEDKKYKAVVAAPEKMMNGLNAEYRNASPDQKRDQAYVDGLQARFNKAQEEKQELQKQYIKQNPDSYLSLIALTEIGGQDIDVATVDPIYKSLSANVRNTIAGQTFAKSIDAARSTSIGAMAPVFIQNDVNDKPVSLSDFHGKYVLVDFWASWCGPCRGENPNVVKAYNQYKTKNFTVLGVSLDRPGKKEAWMAAIKADGLEWTQVSDLKFWDNDVAKLYGIRAIPQNFLLDPSGKIIGKNLRGDDLNKKLASLFN